MHSRIHEFQKLEKYFEPMCKSYQSYIVVHKTSQKQFLLTRYNLQMMNMPPQILQERLLFLCQNYKLFRCEAVFFHNHLPSLDVLRPPVISKFIKYFYIVEPLPMVTLADFGTVNVVKRDFLFSHMPNVLNTIAALHSVRFPYLNISPFSIIFDETLSLRPPPLNPFASPKSLMPPPPKVYRSYFRSINEIRFYRPPEWNSVSPYCSSDSWALGCLFAEYLIFGGPLFGSLSKVDQMKRTQMILGPAPQFLNWAPPTITIPCELPSILLELLDYDPNKRPWICIHLCQRLLSFVHGNGSPEDEITENQPEAPVFNIQELSESDSSEDKHKTKTAVNSPSISPETSPIHPTNEKQSYSTSYTYYTYSKPSDEGSTYTNTYSDNKTPQSNQQKPSHKKHDKNQNLDKKQDQNKPPHSQEQPPKEISKKTPSKFIPPPQQPPKKENDHDSNASLLYDEEEEEEDIEYTPILSTNTYSTPKYSHTTVSAEISTPTTSTSRTKPTTTTTISTSENTHTNSTHNKHHKTIKPTVRISTTNDSDENKYDDDEYDQNSDSSQTDLSTQPITSSVDTTSSRPTTIDTTKPITTTSTSNQSHTSTSDQSPISTNQSTPSTPSTSASRNKNKNTKKNSDKKNKKVAKHKIEIYDDEDDFSEPTYMNNSTNQYNDSNAYSPPFTSQNDDITPSYNHTNESSSSEETPDTSISAENTSHQVESLRQKLSQFEHSVAASRGKRINIPTDSSSTSSDMGEQMHEHIETMKHKLMKIDQQVLDGCEGCAVANVVDHNLRRQEMMMGQTINDLSISSLS